MLLHAGFGSGRNPPCFSRCPDWLGHCARAPSLRVCAGAGLARRHATRGPAPSSPSECSCRPSPPGPRRPLKLSPPAASLRRLVPLALAARAGCVELGTAPQMLAPSPPVRLRFRPGAPVSTVGPVSAAAGGPAAAPSARKRAALQPPSPPSGEGPPALTAREPATKSDSKSAISPWGSAEIYSQSAISSWGPSKSDNQSDSATR